MTIRSVRIGKFQNQFKGQMTIKQLNKLSIRNKFNNYPIYTPKYRHNSF